jgi:uncharacterized membrane protein YfcA
MVWPGAIAIGVSLGLLGSGGSILTVPVLVYLLGQDEKVAIAGSLFIVGSVALKSYSGFYKYLDVLGEQGLELDWPTLGLVTILGVAGSVLGSHLAKRAPQAKLKRWFGYFLIVMGIYILARSAPAALGISM